LLRAAPLNPLLAALPSVLKVTTSDHASNALLAGTAELLAVEVQRAEALSGSYTAARLLEIFCAEILRAYRNDANLGGAGWFRGLADPKLGRALALIHADPATPWSVAKLAAAVALSPSRFASRFRATIGEPAMAYVTRWRMVRACRLLEECEETIDAVARRTGYTTASSFSRAFKASVGKSPAAWRQSRLR
jgi:AraC-like DNA-binding protein